MSINNMTFKCAASYTQLKDSFQAGQMLAKQVLSKMLGECPDFLFIFLSIDQNFSSVLEGIRSILGPIPCIGCSGAGIISNKGSDESGFSVGMMALKSSAIAFHSFHLPCNSENDSFKTGKELGDSVSKHYNPKQQNLLILFSDGHHTNLSHVNKGFQSSFNNLIPCIGGLAGNDFVSTSTYVFHNEKTLTEGLVGCLLVGDFEYYTNYANGYERCDTFEMKVTKANNKELLEINGRPAYQLLNDLCSNLFNANLEDKLLTCALGIPLSENHFITRSFTGHDKNLNSVYLAGSVHEGEELQFLQRTNHEIIKTTRAMADDILNQLSSHSDASYFYIDCVGRGTFLFGNSEFDIENLLDVLGKNKELIGLFSFGEFFSLKNQSLTLFNHTAVLLGLNERKKND